jgi:hypothetical protein
MNGYTREMIDTYKASLKKIVEHLKSYECQCNARPLFNNVAFIALQELADEQDREKYGL